ncbi:ATP-binding protein [Dyella flagellata]|uniref:histidine kinase n=1 Tax=Dyella flagellata TaxID=1867833 RepID=A0ABQ5X729_9GAMM|nr:ATP-binding protein [Dyella flagellata]GLQ87378.1 two-component sensor histidine kinase [Dyella flagellata]
MQLSLWIIGSMLVIGSIATVASYYFAMQEAHALQDDTLKQIGAFATRIPAAVVKQNDLQRSQALSSETSVDIVPLQQDGAAGTCGATREITIPCGLGDGLHALYAHGGRWRVWVGSQPSGLRFAVAQPTALRDEIARDGSMRTLVPMLCLIAALIPLVAGVVRRMLQPVVQLAEALDRADERTVVELPTQGIPSEVAPFIASINRQFKRLRESIAQQRRFVADAAHELRSPLTALTLQAQNLDRLPMTPEMRERIDALRAGLSRGTRLVAQLLSLARLQQDAATASETVAVQELVHQVVDETYAYAESKQTDLGVEQLEALALHADRLALHAALRNLVDNAIRYTPEHGRVDLRAYRDGGWACIEVEDNGPGMRQEDLARACEPFFRAPGTTEIGSGLGLAIAADMARNLGGELSLHTTGSGLLVRLRLPCSDIAARAS